MNNENVFGTILKTESVCYLRKQKKFQRIKILYQATKAQQLERNSKDVKKILIIKQLRIVCVPFKL